MPQVAIRLEIERRDVQAEQEASAEEFTIERMEAAPRGSTSPVLEARFIEPVTLLAAVTLGWLAKRLVDHWLRDQERGVQIDLRTTPPTVSRIAGVPRGFLVIIDREGVARTEKTTYEQSEALVPVLQQLIDQP